MFAHLIELYILRLNIFVTTRETYFMHNIDFHNIFHSKHF